MDPTLVAVILGMAAVTYLPRFLPMVILTRRRLAPWLEDWLALLPPAVVGALAAQAVLAPEGDLALGWNDPFWLAALPTALVACRTRQLALTVLTGVATVALLRALTT